MPKYYAATIECLEINSKVKLFDELKPWKFRAQKGDVVVWFEDHGVASKKEALSAWCAKRGCELQIVSKGLIGKIRNHPHPISFQIESSLPENIEITRLDSARAAECLAYKNKHNIGVHNIEWGIPIDPRFSTRLGALVILNHTPNQPLSVADTQMIAEAFANNCRAKVLIIHNNPDQEVQGSLTERDNEHIHQLAKQHNCELFLSRPHSNMIDIMKLTDKIYTVDADSGLDGALLGTKVHTYGEPTYSGCGLTIDHSAPEETALAYTSSGFFYERYIQKSLYVNPFSQSTCDIEDILELCRANRCTEKGTLSAKLGRQAPRAKIVKKYLQTHSPIAFVAGNTHNCIWGEHGAEPTDRSIFKGPLHELIRIYGHKNVETFTLDQKGLYTLPNKVSSLDDKLNARDMNSRDYRRAQNLKARLITLRDTRETLPFDLSGKDYTLVIGREPQKMASTIYKEYSDKHCIKIARERAPEDTIVYLMTTPNILNRVTRARNIGADVVITQPGKDLANLIAHANSIVTLDSPLGILGIIYDKPVYCTGIPFYYGWGLTEGEVPIAHRQAKLSVDELIFGALIEYPDYLDTKSGIAVRVEEAFWEGE